MTGVSGLGGDFFLLGMEKEAMKGPGVFGSRQQKVCRRGRNIMPTAMEFAVLHDEISGDPVADQVTGSPCMIHPDAQILVHLKVKVRGVHSVVISDRADLLISCYLLSFPHHDPVEMSVE